MTNAKALRAALTAAGAGGLNENKLADKAGISLADLRKVVWAMVNRGEVEKTEQDGVVTYTIDPDYSANRKRPGKRSGKKKAAKKPQRAPRGRSSTTRSVAPEKPSLITLLLGNLAASATHLANTVRAEVENFEENPALSAALEQHARAAALIEAAA